MGRIKEIDRTNKGKYKRKRKAVTYLVCEGSKTEKMYFSRFRSRECLVEIQPVTSQYKSADLLVKKAERSIGTMPYYPEEGDTLWCVFDRDENTDEVLRIAKNTAKKEGYYIAYSNPSFELWFLLHFIDQKAYLNNCEAVIKKLSQKGLLGYYKKSQDIYNELLPLQQEAIERAENRTKELAKKQVEVISRASNPVTTVFELVRYLKEKNEKL